MKNYKTAFTLVEILMVMAIIGIISTIGFSTYKKHEVNSRYLYSNVYHSLDQAIYNAMNYRNLGNPFLDQDETTSEHPDLSNSEQINRLCLMLTEYIRPVGASCSETEGVDTVANHVLNDDGEDIIRNFNVEPQFIANNGVRFWISRRLPDPENLPPNGHYFFIVFADLNGSNAPNSMAYERGATDPDIFAFAVLDIGRVCPLGPPEIDERFMLTRISYRLNPLQRVDEADIRFSSPSKPYFITKAEAWGYYIGGLADDFYMDDNPYTYNGYIRSLLPENNMIYSDMFNEAMPNYAAAINAYEREQRELSGREENVTLKRNLEGGVNCAVGFDDICDLIIDKYSHS